MKGGQTDETAVRWANLSERLGETERRVAASLALIFSDLTDSRSVWKPLVEAITMNESPYLREIRTGARLEVQRDNLTRVLRTKLSGNSLTNAISQVEKQEDLATLSRWFDLSLTLSPEALVAELDK